MMLAETGALVAEASAQRRPLFAFNVITLEHAQAIVAAAGHAERPVILQVSENAVEFQGDAAPIMAACRALAVAAEVPIALHLDHIESERLLHAAPELGVSSVMVDASRLPDEQNLAYTRQAAEWAHERGLFVEAELGEIGGKGGAHTPGVRTDPTDAASFVAGTGVDALAVAVGSSHAMLSRTGALDQALIAELARAVPVPLVLHGSSGIPDDELRAAVRNGMVKINVGTLLNVAFTGAVRAALADDPDGIDPRRYLRQARTATEQAVLRLLREVR